MCFDISSYYRAHTFANLSGNFDKVATAFGGGVARVKSPLELAAMRKLHATYPTQVPRSDRGQAAGRASEPRWSELVASFFLGGVSASVCLLLSLTNTCR